MSSTDKSSQQFYDIPLPSLSVGYSTAELDNLMRLLYPGWDLDVYDWKSFLRLSAHVLPRDEQAWGLFSHEEYNAFITVLNLMPGNVKVTFEQWGGFCSMLAFFSKILQYSEKTAGAENKTTYRDKLVGIFQFLNEVRRGVFASAKNYLQDEKVKTRLAQLPKSVSDDAKRVMSLYCEWFDDRNSRNQAPQPPGRGRQIHELVGRLDGLLSPGAKQTVDADEIRIQARMQQLDAHIAHIDHLIDQLWRAKSAQ